MSEDDRPEQPSLFLAGNARDLVQDENSILARLVRLAGGPGSARVVLIWASSKGVRGFEDLALALEQLGVTDIRTLDIFSREDADRAHAVGLVERATAVILDGDSPRRIVQILRESKLDLALRRRLGESVLIAGFGHGASALAERFLVDGATDPDIGPDPDVVAPITGLGYFPESVVDPFFARDGQPDRLLTALIDRPDDLGFGLDDHAAIHLVNERFEVIGQGAVAVVDAAGAGKFVQHLLNPGDRFDILTRAPIARL